MSIKRGEIYFVNLDPVRGREQACHRPVLVISNDKINKLPLVITVVLGTKGSNVSQNYRTNVRVSPDESGLPMETVFLCFQIRSLDLTRFSDKPAAKLSEEKMKKVEDTIRYCLGL